MTRRKGLTPEQTAELNRTLLFLATHLERQNAKRLAEKAERHADQLSKEVAQLAGELRRA